MTARTAALARQITWRSSKQSYLTARLLVDRDLVEDCFRAYAYFRWADDQVDRPGLTAQARRAFIARQRALAADLYRGVRPGGLAPEEALLADLIAHDRGIRSGLRPFIENVLAILAFDAHRRGRPVSQVELAWYSRCLGVAVTDAIQYFIGNGHPYPAREGRYAAATAAHVVHMLRDFQDDHREGYWNLPAGLLAACAGDGALADQPRFRNWVRSRVAHARASFRQGRAYIDRLPVLRCKIAAACYCVRFEVVLDAIEADGYALRPRYGERQRLATIGRLAGEMAGVTIRHLGGRLPELGARWRRLLDTAGLLDWG